MSSLTVKSALVDAEDEDSEALAGDETDLDNEDDANGIPTAKPLRELWSLEDGTNLFVSICTRLKGTDLSLSQIYHPYL
ncbi:hypothetical protein DFH29DRAFT_1008629 [Suillus ampliporus]|nr:hypothetical protein DFH29DRAFT_1008629 [Suillus ampliporus]